MLKEYKEYLQRILWKRKGCTIVGEKTTWINRGFDITRLWLYERKDARLLRHINST